MPTPRKWVSDAARKAAYRDRLNGIHRPPEYYNEIPRQRETLKNGQVKPPPRIHVEQYVYIIEADSGQLKIGIAANPASRLRSLQTGSPVPLTLLGSIPGGVALERLLHDRFQAHNLQGEWFSPDIREDLMTLLAILDRKHWSR